MNAENINSRAELEGRLSFETLIADLSSKFVNLPAGEVDREIMDAERRICEVLDLDVSAIWMFQRSGSGRLGLRVISRLPTTTAPRKVRNYPCG